MAGFWFLKRKEVLTAIIFDNDLNKASTYNDIAKNLGIKVLAVVTVFDEAKEAIEKHALNARIGFVDRRMVDNTDEYDTSGRVIEKILRARNPKMIIASISASGSTTADISRGEEQPIDEYITAVIALAKAKNITYVDN